MIKIAPSIYNKEIDTMLVDDEITLGLSFRGDIDNYDSLADIIYEVKKIVDDWVTWNVDGDYDFWIDDYD